MSSERRRAPWYEILGFALFDFANSSYTTVIITVVFGNVFWFYIVGDEANGNWLWSLSLGISYIMVLVTAPVLGAFMDFTASKKKFLFGTYMITVVATCALYFVSPGAVVLGMVLIIFSNFGFSSGENIVSAFLPELGSAEDLGKISGYAWGLGYFGGIGSALLVMAITGFSPTEGDYEVKRLVGPLTGVFFLIAGIPTFLLLKERAKSRPLPPGQTLLTIGFSRLGGTLADIRQFRDLVRFLISYFFAYSGLAIVISFAFIYGEQEIKWTGSAAAIMFILTNLSAAVGAVLFGMIQDRIGDKLTYNITLVIWIVAVLLIYGAPEVTALINAVLGTELLTETVFLGIGALAGLCLGATQTASRAVTGVFTPASKSGEFFGLWGLATKLAAAVGLITYGLFTLAVGIKMSILLCAGFFAIGLLINLLTDEARGRAAAENYVEK
ncbi:MAG: MFS transporter [bacterium]|nr:MFS transporter [bacterium]